MFVRHRRSRQCGNFDSYQGFICRQLAGAGTRIVDPNATSGFEVFQRKVCCFAACLTRPRKWLPPAAPNTGPLLAHITGVNTLVKAVLDLLVAHQIVPDKATALVGQR